MNNLIFFELFFYSLLSTCWILSIFSMSMYKYDRIRIFKFIWNKEKKRNKNKHIDRLNRENTVMFKSIVLLALFATVYSQNLGGLFAVPQITQEVVDIAHWCTNQLTSVYNYEGEYHIVNIKDYKKQIVAGTNHYFTVDYAVLYKDNSIEVNVWFYRFTILMLFD